jgi:hypothetical protein
LVGDMLKILGMTKSYWMFKRKEKLEMLYEFDGDGFLSKESKLMFMSLTIEGGN